MRQFRLRSNRLACIYVFAGIIALCFCPASVSAAETVILSVTLNSVPQGDFFLKRKEDGTLFLRSEDGLKIGLKTASVSVSSIDDQSYISLKELSGVSVTFDEKLLLLDLRAGAAWVDLPRVVRDFSTIPRLYAPVSDASAFLNYRLDYGNGNDAGGAIWSATGQAGLRRGNLLLLGDGLYQYTQNTQQAVRLMTNLTWDRPGTLSRWVAGDVNATAGEPSGPIIMGGISYASAFMMAPGLVIYPQGDFGGVTTLPTEADIYVNGILVRREHLAPGDYRFRNLPVSSGSNNVEILMRDSFGNESRNSTQFYLSDNLLKAGLHDYSYNLGFVRRDFGSSSNHYGPPLLVARHSFGLSDSLTLGSGVEISDQLVNIIPRAVMGVPRMGVLTLMGGESHDRDRGFGTAAGVGHQFQSRYINYQLSLSLNSRGYRTLANRQAADTARLAGRAGISMGTPAFGTVSLTGSYVETYAGLLKHALGVSYSRSLTKKIQFSASWNTSWGTSRENTFFAGLSFFPMHDLTASAALQTASGSNMEMLSLQKSQPTGEGIGYQATVERERSQDQTKVRVNPFVQYNGHYGIYNADLHGQFDEHTGRMTERYQLSAAGALVYAGGHLALSRPVSGSFAVVQVEGLSDVAVLLDNQEVARTNADGIAYIPALRAYQENLIAFDDHQVAANYLIKHYSSVVIPGLFGGECIYFPVARIQAYGGRLLARNGTPLEYAQVMLRGMGQKIQFSTLAGGEFYFENMVDDVHESGRRSETCGAPSPYRRTIVPGMYAVTVVVGGSERHFNLLIPVSDAIFVPLGEFFLSDSPTQ